LVATGKQEKISYGNHAYRFFTPRQIFTIWKKEEHPLWIMPDWAYHELGKEPPPMNERQGIPNVLGDYALYLQDGYMIHGTIQNADLGKYLTHGCVSMGKQDLKALYAFVPIGTKVYIY
jgi:L,D-transpeptidase YbiS